MLVLAGLALIIGRKKNKKYTNNKSSILCIYCQCKMDRLGFKIIIIVDDVYSIFCRHLPCVVAGADYNNDDDIC